MSQSNLPWVSALASPRAATQECEFDLAGLVRRINRQLIPKFVSARAVVTNRYGDRYVTINGFIETHRREEFNDLMASIVSREDAQHISAFMYSKPDKPEITLFETDPLIA